MKLKSFIGAFFWVSVCQAQVTRLPNIVELMIQSISGDIKVLKSEDPVTTVEVEKVFLDKKCSIERKIVQDGADIRVKADNIISPHSCKVNFTVKTSQPLIYKLRVHSGNIDISRIKGKVHFNVKSGNVKVRGQIDQLVGQVQTGRVEASGLEGNSQVRVKNGDVTLSYKKELKNGFSAIATDTGNSTLFIPQDSKVLTSLKSKNGSVISHFKNSLNSSFTITVKSEDGNIYLNKIVEKKINEKKVRDQ